VISAFIVPKTFDPEPTPTATPFPTPITPFEEPTPAPSGTGDLQPYFGNGQPVRVRNPQGGPFVEKSDLVVDFFVTNAGGGTITGDYFIDLYIDDSIAQRYNGIDIQPDHFIFIEGGTGLLDVFQLEPGEHEVKLVIDPANLVPELSDGDNTHSTNFTWDGPAIPAPLPTDRLPNLSLTGGLTGITAAPFEGASISGGLSTKGVTYFSFSVLNDSPISITHDFNLSVMFDDVLVHNAHYTGLIGGEYISLEWADLTSAVHVTPGEHTVKLVADPDGAITESDESDNTAEITLIWGTGDPIPAPADAVSLGAPIREVQVLTNLTGATPYGWDAAISERSVSEGLGIGNDGDIWASADTTISFAIRNSSRVNSADSGSFSAQIYLNDELIETINLEPGNDAGDFWTQSVVIPAGSVDPGEHLLKLVLDSEDDILEANEEDNSLGRWFEFLPGEADSSSPPAFGFTDEQLSELLAPLTESAFTDQVIAIVGSGFDLPEWSSDIENIGRAGYYLLTNRDLEAERVVMHLLPHDQFIAASFSTCMDDFFLLPDPTYITTYDACTSFRGEIGFQVPLERQGARLRRSWRIAYQDARRVLPRAGSCASGS
jgi:hypothetical protein